MSKIEMKKRIEKDEYILKKQKEYLEEFFNSHEKDREIILIGHISTLMEMREEGIL